MRVPEAKGRPAASAYGRPSTAGRPMPGRPAPGQMPDPEPSKHCEWDGEQRCTAFKAKGTPYCIGHLRSVQKRGEYIDA